MFSRTGKPELFLRVVFGFTVIIAGSALSHFYSSQLVGGSRASLTLRVIAGLRALLGGMSSYIRNGITRTYTTVTRSFWANLVTRRTRSPVVPSPYAVGLRKSCKLYPAKIQTDGKTHPYDLPGGEEEADAMLRRAKKETGRIGLQHSYEMRDGVLMHCVYWLEKAAA